MATFTNLSITGAAGAYTVRFTSGALTPDTSTAVTIGAGAAARLAIVQQPSATVQNAVVLPVQPTVQLVDGAGNPVAQLGTPVTVSILTGSGTLGGTATMNTNAGGLATFTNLSITGTVGARTLLFSSGALVTDTSTVVTVTVPTPVLFNVPLTAITSLEGESDLSTGDRPAAVIE